jgi:hypothetical protein
MKLLNGILLHYLVMKKTLIVTALAISTMLVLIGTVLAVLDNKISQLVYAQTNATSTTDNITVAKSDNITAPVAPQGTSINASDTTTP